MAFHPNWKALSTVDFSWKEFVREGTVSLPSPKLNVHKSAITLECQPLSGVEAKRFYEEVTSSYDLPKFEKNPIFNNTDLLQSKKNIIQSHNSDLTIYNTSQRPSSKESKDHTSSNNCENVAWLNTIMKEAQNNNVQSVSKLLDDVSDINVKDQYGWTLLMCAACAGAIDVVKYLIKIGANVNVRDKSGNNCLSLAKCNGHFMVAKMIELNSSYFQHLPNDSNMQEQSSVSHKNYFCQECKQSFHDTTEVQHMTSTLHLFNCPPQYSPTLYGIPASNKGYQILLKGGWDQERGLGPEGTGLKFPPKTVLKRDREGLGAEREKPRVTHFAANDTEAVHVTNKFLNKCKRTSRLQKERRMERNFRRQFNSLD